MSMATTIRFTMFVISTAFLHTLTLADKKTYIVYLGTQLNGLQSEQDVEVTTQSHYDLLGSVLGSQEKAKESVLYNYNRYINGFAAKLSEAEVKRIKESPNVLSVIENRQLELHTTRSWEFLGLEHNGVTPSDSLWNISDYGNDVIIGNLDTGVWPESESFSDLELGPIPSRWKGACKTGSDEKFKCNKKLIGARYFIERDANLTDTSFLTPRDVNGHGTHTLSTVGGTFVKRVNVSGFGSGIAKGGSPKARVAAYKVCWTFKNGSSGCSMTNILAAFEAAIGDGVDVLSLSIGGPSIDYIKDGIAIAAFHAVRNGITVVASAGNGGPRNSSVTNIAPWIFTIGASTIDRNFYNQVYLGNSTLHFKGKSMGPDKFQSEREFYPLIDAASASSNSSNSTQSRFCIEGSLDPLKVKGKIVVCEVGQTSNLRKGLIVKSAGGVGMILINDALNGDMLSSEQHFLPASHISYKDGLVVLDYIKNTTNPTAYIDNGTTEVGIKPSPTMAFFSSRGPSSKRPQILKPDITAPGVDVIAAYSGAVAPSHFPNDTRRANYASLSGTSMSCPHVSGIVGLLKTVHPDWNPAVIRSALMTTATTFDNENNTILDYDKQQATPFSYGAGHINPNAAVNPGLVYNLTENDYLDFLCSFYLEENLKVFTPIPHKCNKSKSILDFNYPSITITNFTTTATLSRTLTNVGTSGTYEVKVTAPNGVNIIVIPSTLKFNKIGEEQTYRVELKAVGGKHNSTEYVFGSLVWSDGSHNVRSPIVVERV